jgi:uncharacterized membrane protein
VDGESLQRRFGGGLLVPQLPVLGAVTDIVHRFWWRIGAWVVFGFAAASLPFLALYAFRWLSWAIGHGAQPHELQRPADLIVVSTALAVGAAGDMLLRQILDLM